MKPKSVIIVIMLFAACVAGMGAVSIFHQPHVFYSGEGEPIPYHAVDSLVRSTFVNLSKSGNDTLAVYFDTPAVDLPEEYRSIMPTDNLTGYWLDGVLHIEFNNSEKP